MADFYASSSAELATLVATRDYGEMHTELVSLTMVRSYRAAVEMPSGGSSAPPRPTVGLLYPR